jgi:hypothetical protein
MNRVIATTDSDMAYEFYTKEWNGDYEKLRDEFWTLVEKEEFVVDDDDILTELVVFNNGYKVRDSYIK